jgi:hypothetical protein
LLDGTEFPRMVMVFDEMEERAKQADAENGKLRRLPI